ncbi:bifunctional isocitrate dehydrogenase kinase/phosphatase [Thioalkalivibrio paradoxus]|uniref:bifunctional isocitrate dehydrogenase kinase/phosphatase n=1 Tax=Thioalkalivibrio paradoxus TaxID=108010 RepID=UPI00022C3E91|nr:bifunctional isocitrate dehydrogenase kinase/phosphatase [Thioalkalivibrio paradoxus]
MATAREQLATCPEREGPDTLASRRGRHRRASQLARAILTGFERHYSFFAEITSDARQRFERADWDAVREASAQRISFYDDRVRETIAKLHSTFEIDCLDEPLWQEVKRLYTDLLRHHSRPELAETFFNSVFCQLFARKYYHNDNIFVESTIDRTELAAHYRVCMSFHPRAAGLEQCIWEILSAFYFSIPYEDIDRDVQRIAEAFRERAPQAAARMEELRIDVLESPFFRNKAAYLIGRVTWDEEVEPFVIPLINTEQGAIRADTLLTTREQMEAVFNFARAYFMAKTPVPAATVAFLQTLMPDKPLAELYMSIGFQKQAKNEFYRDFLAHLAQSGDEFKLAEGTPGMVMLVFTLPSYGYVFKVIRDRFPPPKDVTHEQVKQRYQQVKLHDRVGRMADTLEFSDVAFPLDRFPPELLAELRAEIPSLLEFDGDALVIKHLYIERRMLPLNLFLDEADFEEREAVLDDWGLAIKQLMAVNIFPGDLLFKNFGVNCLGKVVFYDYDEIAYLTDCNFRRIPAAMTPEDELSAEPWFSVGPHDIFPEEFPTFLCQDPEVRQILNDTHPELFDYRYWRARQQDIRDGVHGDVFPYSSQIRFPHPQ